MWRLIRISLAGLFCVGIAAAVVIWFWVWAGLVEGYRGKFSAAIRRGGSEHMRALLTMPSAKIARRQPFELVLEKFEDGGYETAVRFMAPIKDLGSLQELREAIRSRGRACRRCRRITSGSSSNPNPIATTRSRRCSSSNRSAWCTCTTGDFLRPYMVSKSPGNGLKRRVAGDIQGRIKALLGIVAMRRGEIENCLECAGPSS